MATRSLHPFPARMAPEIAISQLTASTSKKPQVVLDPMCGSGTVLAAATAHGKAAYGFDVDPLAVLISRVQTGPVDTGAFIRQGHLCADGALKEGDATPPWRDAETCRFAEYWFGKKQRHQLSALSRMIHRTHDVAIRDALKIALSRLIITKSPKASLAADTSHSRPHKVLNDSAFDVIDGFRRSLIDLSAILDRRELAASAVVRLGDARALPDDAPIADIVVTSPPYLNAIDYMRGHRLSLIWLEYTIPELRAIRSGSIGAERGLASAPTPQVEDIAQQIEAMIDSPESLPRRMILRYAHDLAMFATQLAQVTRPGAKVVTVIGNSTLRGNYIRNDLIVEHAYRQAGFRIGGRHERELPENRRYLPVKTSDPHSALVKRMRSEIVLESIAPGVQLTSRVESSAHA